MNIFKASVHENTSISQTNRITYPQNSASGKSKDLIRGYSCKPSFYNVAMAELESRFGSPQHIVTAYIHRLENWALITSQNPHTLVSFFAFLKQLVQTFLNLRFTADLQSSKVLTVAKAKLLHNLLLKWTEHTVKNNILSPSSLIFSKGWRFKPEFLKLLNRTSLDQTNHLSRSRDHGLPRKKPKKMNVRSVTNIFRSLAVRNISILPCKIENSMFKVCICFNCLGQSHLKKDCPWSKHCFKPNCGALHHTSLHTSDSKNRHPNVKKTCSDKPQRGPASTQAPENCPKRFNSCPSNSPIKFSQQQLPTSVQLLTVQFYCKCWPRKRTVSENAFSPSSHSCVSGQWRQSFWHLCFDRPWKHRNIRPQKHRPLSGFRNWTPIWFRCSVHEPVSFLFRPSHSIQNSPYADNETQFEIKNAYTTTCLNIPPAKISNLNGICQSNSMLRHIKFPDIDKGRIGVLLGTSCVQFTHALEWIRGSPNWPAGLRNRNPPKRCSFHLTCLNNIGQSKKQPVNRPNPSFSPMSTTNPSKYLKNRVATAANVMKLAFRGKLRFTHWTITTLPSTVSVPSKNV